MWHVQKSRKSDIRLIRMLSLVRCWQTVPSIRQPAVQKDVVLTMKKNRMQYFFSDVQLRGEYPVYALRYFKERNINIQMEDGDEEVIRNNTMEFLAISYYYSRVVDSDKNDMTPMQAEQNPNLEPTPWEWRMDSAGIL